MSQVVAQIGLEVLQYLLVLLGEETWGLSSDFAKSIENLLTAVIVESDVFWKLALTLEFDLNKLTELWVVANQTITSEDLEVFVYMSEILQIVDIVLVGF